MNYKSAHDLVRAAKGRADSHICSCGKPARDWCYDYSDPNELTDPRGLVYSTDPERYHARCRSCHKYLDNTSREARRMAASLTS